MTLIRALVVMVVSRWSDYPTLTTGKTLYYQGTDDFSGRSDAVFNFLRGEIEKAYIHNVYKRISKSDHFDHHIGSIPIKSRPRVGGQTVFSDHCSTTPTTGQRR